MKVEKQEDEEERRKGTIHTYTNKRKRFEKSKKSREKEQEGICKAEEGAKYLGREKESLPQREPKIQSQRVRERD